MEEMRRGLLREEETRAFLDLFIILWWSSEELNRESVELKLERVVDDAIWGSKK